MEISQIFTYSSILILLGVLVFVVSFRWLRSDNMDLRLREYVEEEIEGAQRDRSTVIIPKRQLTGSVASRLVSPLARSFIRLIARLTPASAIDNIRRQLTVAGSPTGLGPREFFALRWAFAGLGLVLAIVILRQGLDLRTMTLAALAFVICFLAPSYWLSRKVRTRQNLMRKGLPDALDMLSVCSSAGLGFDQALLRISEHWNTPIGIEFGKVINEMEMGFSRRDALRNLAERANVQELSSFIAFVLQSEQLGMSLSETLHSQAAQMRIERRFRAQEQAQKIPSKMLIPMAFLIFPAILAVVLGPAIPQIVEAFGNM